jgi:hypothetical protein
MGSFSFTMCYGDLENIKKVKEIGTFCDGFKKTASIEKRI